MTTLKIYDGNNFARIRFEADPTGLPLRSLFTEAFFDPTPSIFIFDGKDSKALRLAQYPEYKSKRKAAPDNFYVMLGYYKELLMHTNKVLVDVPGYEGDDVIATLVQDHPDLEIVIHSTDRDFCALENEKVTIPAANLKGVAAPEVRLYKTLVGDDSDTISGIRLFGDKAWELLTASHKGYWVKCLKERSLGTADPFLLGLTRQLFSNWMIHNHKLLQTFWDIIGFYDVPRALIAQHTTVGTPNYELAHSKLSELLQ